MYLLILVFLPATLSLQCINSTSYMDRMLVKPMSSTCEGMKALCVKTMQISRHTDGSPEVLSIHRECYELKPPPSYTREHDCIDSYDDNDPAYRRLGPHLITCYCSSDLCNF